MSHPAFPLAHFTFPPTTSTTHHSRLFRWQVRNTLGYFKTALHAMQLAPHSPLSQDLRFPDRKHACAHKHEVCIGGSHINPLYSVRSGFSCFNGRAGIPRILPSSSAVKLEHSAENVSDKMTITAGRAPVGCRRVGGPHRTLPAFHETG